MAQILVFGASTAYGVGGPAGGWPDILKKKLHEQMYTIKDLPFEKHEVYNLCVPGATIDDIEKRLTVEVDGYSKPGREIIVVIELGGNDSKAIEKNDNFANTPEQFYEQMKKLCEQALSLRAKVILVGLQAVDESKTAPRTNPNTGHKSFFKNERMELFEKQIANVAQELRVDFVPVFADFSVSHQIDNLLFDDGLHPNKAGHEWLFKKVWKVLESLL